MACTAQLEGKELAAYDTEDLCLLARATALTKGGEDMLQGAEVAVALLRRNKFDGKSAKAATEAMWNVVCADWSGLLVELITITVAKVRGARSAEMGRCKS